MKPTCSAVREDMDLLKYLSPYGSPQTIPVSFMLGETRIDGIPERFHPVMERETLADGVCRTTITGVCDGLEIKAECLTYPDFPVTEWRAFLTNRGDCATERISSFCISPAVFAGTAPKLHTWNGDNRTVNAFTDAYISLAESFEFYPIGGNPCNNASPYMRLLLEEFSVNLAVGWPAQWRLDTEPVANGVKLRVGQQLLDTVLYPGETIHSVRLTLMGFTGDEVRGANLWRRWFIKYIMVKEDGKPLRPKCIGLGKPLTCSEYEDATTAQQLRELDKFLASGLDIDVWWVDAGWYPCDNVWYRTGTIAPNPEHFPDGMSEIGKKCNENGIEYLLWFEPERVTPGSKLHKEHPEWLLKRNSLTWQSDMQSIDPGVLELRDSYLLNLGMEECLNGIIEQVDAVIKQAGVKVYREDFNISPLPFWIEHDKPDRIGMLENTYAVNLKRFWQALIERNPGLWIDSCASGGRRNDLETLRTPAVPLHYSDTCYGMHPGKQRHTRFMYEWIPYFKGQCGVDWDDEHGHYEDKNIHHRLTPFSYYSGLGPAVYAFSRETLGEMSNAANMCLVKRMLGIWRRAAELMLSGDYYALTHLPHNEYEWFADQFDAGDKGYILFLRNTCAGAENLTVQPFLDETAAYRFENSETGEVFVMSGAEASKGLTMALPKRSGVILFYEKAN